MRRALALALCLLSGLSLTGRAQRQVPLTSNRPGIGESESLVPEGAVQIEAGLTDARLGAGADRQHLLDFPEVTVRVGVSRRVEVFGSTAGLWLDRTAGAVDAHGGADVQLNTKIGLLASRRTLVSLAGGLSVPTGSGPFTSGGYDPSLRLLWSRALPGDRSLGGNVVLADTTVSAHKHAAATGASLAAGHALVGPSAWFAEVFATATRHDTVQWRADGGLAIPCGTNCQVDVSGGRALTSTPRAWFLAAGITARHLPHRH